MSSSPAISVILPTYNRAALLPRSIGSVLRQTVADLELIVVDDGSTDGTRDVVQSMADPRVRYVRRDARGGPAAARNTGVREARAQWLAFQDSDDEWLPDKLALQMDSLARAGPACELSICGLVRGGRTYLDAPGRDPSEITFDTALGNPTRYVHSQCWLARRDAVLEAGLFDENLFLWDDWDLLIRLTRRHPACTVARPLAISNKSPDSISASTNAKWADAMRYVIGKHASDLSPRPAIAGLLWYAHAYLLGREGRLVESRQSLLRSLRARPTRLKPWLLLAATAFGTRFVQSLMALRSADSPRTGP